MSDPNTNAPEPQPNPDAAAESQTVKAHDPQAHDTQAPTEPQSAPQAQAEAHAAPQADPYPQQAAQHPQQTAPYSQQAAPYPPQPEQPKAKKLSPFLKVSIVLLAGLTVASISLLFIGDFEGKFERVFSTFVLFAVFVLFTAFDTRREQKSEWYAPVALIANSYILALMLIVIWMTPYDPYALLFEIIWKAILVIAVVRLAILCCQLLLRGEHEQPVAVTRFAFVTSVLTVLSAILFTAPVGIESFDLTIPELYWKIATAILILTALGLSITLLLRWYYGSDRREAARAAAIAQHEAYQSQLQAQQAQAQQAQAQQAVAPAQPAPYRAEPPQQPDGQQLLPWPTFTDGTPLPAGPDGQPDFSVVQQPR